MVWRRDLDGLRLTFHLAGINNQNFIMRDEETGTYWQQISGRAISGPLAGRQLTLVPYDELTFGLWKTEEPAGSVLKDVAAYASEYEPRDWDVKMKKTPTVISNALPGLAPRDLMIGVHAGGASRAFPYDLVLKEKLVKDQVGTEPVLIVAGPDGESIRAFSGRLPGVDALPDFYHAGDFLLDEATGSKWNFQGCAIEGKSKGACLGRIEAIKDYWFDWKQYNPATSVYGRRL